MTRLTMQQQEEIRQIKKVGGWEAVEKHPVYGPLWKKINEEIHAEVASGKLHRRRR